MHICIPNTCILILYTFSDCSNLHNKANELTTAIDQLCNTTHTPTAQPTYYSQYNWTSVPKTSIGTSNLQEASTFSFTIPDIVPSTAKEVLVHAGVFSGHSNTGPYHDLKIYTQTGTNRYEKYLLIYSWNQQAYNTNSDNMWFPMPPNRLVYLTVPATHGDNAGVRLFVIGYR